MHYLCYTRNIISAIVLCCVHNAQLISVGNIKYSKLMHHLNIESNSKPILQVHALYEYSYMYLGAIVMPLLNRIQVMTHMATVKKITKAYTSRYFLSGRGELIHGSRGDLMLQPRCHVKVYSSLMRWSVTVLQRKNTRSPFEPNYL